MCLCFCFIVIIGQLHRLFANESLFILFHVISILVISYSVSTPYSIAILAKQKKKKAAILFKI